MGELAQAVRSQALPKGPDQQVNVDNRAMPDIVAPLSDMVGADALGSTLNQTPQVQRLANLEGTMNTGPRAGDLAQLRAALNTSRPHAGVVQRGKNFDPTGDEWLETWYGKKRGKKSMTATRKFTQMLNNVLNAKEFAEQNQNVKPNLVDRIDDVSWDDMQGSLLSAMMSFHTHIAPFVPIEGQGYDRDRKGKGGKYYRGNAHRYKDIYKAIAGRIPSVKEQLDANEKLEVIEPLNDPLVARLLALAVESSDLKRVSKSKSNEVDLFDAPSTYKEFGSLAVGRTNFALLDRAQVLLEKYKDNPFVDPMGISLLLAGDETGVARAYRKTGREFRKGRTAIPTQKLLQDTVKGVQGMVAPATKEPFHDFMLRDRGQTVDRLSAMVNESAQTKFQAVGAERHPSLIVHNTELPAGKGREQSTALRNWERQFIDKIQKPGSADDWNVLATKRSSFGFVRPTISRVGKSIRMWPGYAPETVLAEKLKHVLDINETKLTSSSDEKPDDPILHVEALKAAVRHALIVLQRGRADELTEGPAALRDWLHTRLAINLKKAQYLLGMARDGGATSDTMKDENSEETTAKKTVKSLNISQHYLKSAEVIERLQEYAFQYAALTFNPKEKSKEPPEEDPYEKYISTAAFTSGKQHMTFYLDSGMQALNIAKLFARNIEKKADTEDARVKMHHSYFENEAVRRALRYDPVKSGQATKKGDVVSADLSPVLIEGLGKDPRLSTEQHKTEIKSSLVPGTIPVLDVTNSTLQNVNDLVAEQSRTKAANFIIAESLVKHSQLGADKYSMGRLVVVGNEDFIKQAAEFIKPFADAAHHPLLREFRRNMDEVLYGDSVVDLSASWTAGFADRAKMYTPFMTAMGFEKSWLAAIGQDDPNTLDTMSMDKQTVSESDPSAGWELLHRAFDKYVELTIEPVGKDSTALDVTFNTLPLPDQNELRRRIEQILLPDDVKQSASFADLATDLATPTGISNAGNSCYLAAGLNMLAFSGYFDFFAANVDMDEPHAALKATIAGILGDIRGGTPIVMDRITGLLTALEQRQLLPTPGAEALGRGTRATVAQQDPNEVFFRKILDYFGDALGNFRLTQTYRTEIQNRATNPAVGGDPDKYSALDISDSFSTVHADLAVELPITGAADLRNAMARYLEAETISGVKYVDQGEEDDAVYEGEGKRTIGLGLQTPYTLTISLKRWAGLHKDIRAIDMPERFVLNGFVYRIDAVVYHRGRQSTSGHYTANTRTPGGNDWQYRDDKAVANDPNAIARRQFGYLYTYSRERAATQDDGFLDIGNPGPYAALPEVDIGTGEDQGIEVEEEKFAKPKKKGGKPKPNSKRASSKKDDAAKSVPLKRQREAKASKSEKDAKKTPETKRRKKTPANKDKKMTD